MMKIGPIDTKPQAAPVASERKAATTHAGGHGGAGKAAEASTQVDLASSKALDAAGNGDGSFDAEKVQRIAQAIREGRFRIDAETVADKLIANARELLGGKTPS